MTRQTKRPRAANSWPRDKQTNTGALYSVYDSRVTKLEQTVKYSDLTSPQIIPVCWACGSTERVTTYHAAGGILGVCNRCGHGGQP